MKTMSALAGGALSTILILVLATGCGQREERQVLSDVQDDDTARRTWKILGPGGGGSTFYPTFHPRNPETILLRCDMTGTYLTTDGGENWEMHNFASSASAYAFDPVKPEVAYVGDKGLHRTTDSGRSWKLLFPKESEIIERRYLGDHAGLSYVVREGSSYPGPSASVSAILIDPDLSRRIYLGVSRRAVDGSRAGLFVSDDNGDSWREAAALDGAVLGLFTRIESNEVHIFTSTSHYLYNEEYGSCEKTSLPDEMVPVSRVAGGVDPDNDIFRFYAVSPTRQEDGRLTGGIFVSVEGVSVWDNVTEYIRAMSSLAPEENMPSFRYISCSPLDSRTAYLVCDRFMDTNPRGESGHWYGIFKTTDSGQTWKWVYRAGGGASDYTVRDGWLADNEQDSWVREAFGGEFILVICTGVFPSNPEIAMFTDWYRTMKTVDGGETWQEVYSRELEDGSYVSRGLDVTTCYGVHFDPFDKDHIAVSYTDIGYWHSYNGGESWLRSVEGVPPAWDNTCYWMQFDPEEEGRLWSAWSSWHDIPKLKMIRNPRWRELAVGGVCVSEDGGRTWEVSSSGLPENSPTTCLLLDPESPPGGRTLYAAVYGQGVYKSTDNGVTWREKNSGIGENRNAWEISRDTDGNLYLVVTFDIDHARGDGPDVLVPGALYRSTDGAGSWQQMNLPPLSKFPNSLTIHPDNPDKLYLSCWASVTTSDYGGAPEQGTTAGGKFPRPVIEARGGVLYSDDRGETWRQIFDPDDYVYALAVDPEQPESLYISTFTYAAWLSPDNGGHWQKMEDYDFHWGHRVVPDRHDPQKVYLTTFGGSVWHGKPGDIR